MGIHKASSFFLLFLISVSMTDLLALNLNQLLVGKEATISSINDEELAVKLFELGCTPGEKVVVTNKAAFGGPLAIYVMGYKLGLRKEEAEMIIVNPIRPT